MSATATPPAGRSWTTIDWRAHVHDAEIAGRRVRYVDYGDGPVLVLLHGLGCCWQWWLETLPSLGAQRRVIAVDLPGFGSSDQLPAPATMSSHAAAISALCAQLGLERVTVAGHSMGGLVALAMARTAPELVARVILVNAGGVPMTEARLRAVIAVITLMHRGLRRPELLRALAYRPRLRGLLARVAIGDSHALSRELAAEVVPQMASAGFADAVLAAGIAVRDTEPESIRCPVLLLWGDRDPIVPLHTAGAMARRLPDARLVLIPGAGHAPMVQRPREFERHVLRFTNENAEELR